MVWFCKSTSSIREDEFEAKEKIMEEEISTLKRQLAAAQNETKTAESKLRELVASARVQQPESGFEMGRQERANLGNVEERVELHFKCQDPKFVDEIFEQFKDPTLGKLPRNRVRPALRGLGIMGMSEQDLETVFFSSDPDGSDGVDGNEFFRALTVATNLERWLESLHIPRLLSRCFPPPRTSPKCDPAIVPPTDEDALRDACLLSQSELDSVLGVFSHGLRRLLNESLEKLRNGYGRSERQCSRGRAAAASKFSTFKLTSGTIVEFHRGMQDRIGYPNPQVMEGMSSEHIVMFGADRTFTTVNYGITTCPRNEFEIVTGKPCPEAHMLDFDGKRVRRVRPLAELRGEKVSREAGLTDAEIIGVVLYSGPMYQLYNILLRRYPVEEFEAHRVGGNLFPTTIHVIVSAIAKISQAIKLPSRLKLYRGLAGGPAELPERFFKPDTRGCRGYMEFGFLSTTQDRNVAYEYARSVGGGAINSGSGGGRQVAMVLEMETDSVNRGAWIGDLSQYPAEKEFLWPPCSFIQPAGAPKVTVAEGGTVLTVVRARVAANLKTLRVDELLSQKKDMHLTSARYALEQLPSQLRRLALDCRADEKLRTDPHRRLKGVEHTLSGFIDNLVSKVWEVLEAQRKVPAERFLSDAAFRRLSMEMLDARTHAITSLRHYIENPSILIDSTYDMPLLRSHRQYLAFLQRSLPPSGHPDRAQAARRLLVALGAVESSADEINALGEPRIVSAAHEGHPLILRLLVAAGSPVNAAGAGRDAATPLVCAAAMGHEEAVELLCTLGADPEDGDRTALAAAAFHGQAGTAQILLRRGARADAADGQGCTPLILASMRNHMPVVELLCAVAAGAGPGPAATGNGTSGGGGGGVVISARSSGRRLNVDAQDSSGNSALMYAAEYGHLEVAKALVEKGGADLNRAHGRSGATPLHIAANFRHPAVLDYLCSRSADPDPRRGDGRTPLMCAALVCAPSVAALLKRGARVDAHDRKGATPLLLASMRGQLASVDLLRGRGAATNHHDSLGYTPLMLAAKNGHLPVARRLCEDRESPADLAATRGAAAGDAAAAGETALSLAEAAGHEEVAQYLRARLAAAGLPVPAPVPASPPRARTGSAHDSDGPPPPPPPR